MIPAEDPPHALSLSHARGRAPAMLTSTRLGSRSPRHKPPSSSGVLDERAHAPVGSVWIDMVIRGKSLHSAGPKPGRSDDRSARRAQAPSTHQPPTLGPRREGGQGGATHTRRREPHRTATPRLRSSNARNTTRGRGDVPRTPPSLASYSLRTLRDHTRDGLASGSLSLARPRACSCHADLHIAGVTLSPAQAAVVVRCPRFVRRRTGIDERRVCARPSAARRGAASLTQAPLR